MGNYYVTKAEELSRDIKNWDCFNIEVLLELFNQLIKCSESAEFDLSDYLPKDIPTAWKPKSSNDKVWAVDREGRGLTGDDISALEIEDYHDEMIEEFTDRAEEISEKIIDWDCRDINQLFEWINELKKLIEITEEELIDYLPDELPSKWIPEEVISYPIRAIDINGIALAGENYDEIIELDQLMQKI